VCSHYKSQKEKKSDGIHSTKAKEVHNTSMQKNLESFYVRAFLFAKNWSNFRLPQKDCYTLLLVSECLGRVFFFLNPISSLRVTVKTNLSSFIDQMDDRFTLKILKRLYFKVKFKLSIFIKLEDICTILFKQT